MLRSTNRRDRRRASPRLEGLEDRKLLYATLGASWTYGSRITYSFAPDGTNIGGNASVLYQAMQNRGITVSQWQTAFQKAAALWQSVTNINIAQVPDNGAAFGSAGNQQGDPNFGDIRVGGTALGSGTLAGAYLPPPINGGTLAGDVVFNTNQLWGINTNYDVQTVAIHELGHALGLDHSASTQADLYAYYNATKQSLNTDDTAGVQSIYGARPDDAFDAVASNQAYTTSSNITPYLNGAAQETLTGLDIKAYSDLDWYQVTAPANTNGTISVTVQSSNLSSLNPVVSLYNGATKALIATSSAGTFGATVTVAASAQPGQFFYIKVGAANTGAGSNGAYALLVNLGSSAQAPAAPPNTVVYAQPDQGGGTSYDSIGGPARTNHDGHGYDGDTVQIGTLRAAGDDLTIARSFRLGRDHHGRRGNPPRHHHHADHSAVDAAIRGLHRHG